VNPIFLKLRRPLYWGLEPCWYDLVGFADEACTQELCTWPEHSRDRWPVCERSTRVLHNEYEIRWADPQDLVRIEMRERWDRGEPSQPPHTGKSKTSILAGAQNR
jgi:hypothetical protein